MKLSKTTLIWGWRLLLAAWAFEGIILALFLWFYAKAYLPAWLVAVENIFWLVLVIFVRWLEQHEKGND